MTVHGSSPRRLRRLPFHQFRRQDHRRRILAPICASSTRTIYGYWHGTLAGFRTTLDDAAARWGKPVFVAETAYPFRLDSEDSHENISNTSDELVSGYPASVAGRTRWTT